MSRKKREGEEKRRERERGEREREAHTHKQDPRDFLEVIYPCLEKTHRRLARLVPPTLLGLLLYFVLVLADLIVLVVLAFHVLAPSELLQTDLFLGCLSCLKKAEATTQKKKKIPRVDLTRILFCESLCVSL